VKYKTKTDFFVFISEVQPTFDEVKGSANRVKYKTKTDFFVFISEVQPTFDVVKGTIKRAKCQIYFCFSLRDMLLQLTLSCSSIAGTFAYILHDSKNFSLTNFTLKIAQTITFSHNHLCFCWLNSDGCYFEPSPTITFLALSSFQAARSAQKAGCSR
jgi:hypothetical protein